MLNRADVFLGGCSVCLPDGLLCLFKSLYVVFTIGVSICMQMGLLKLIYRFLKALGICDTE